MNIFKLILLKKKTTGSPTIRSYNNRESVDFTIKTNLKSMLMNANDFTGGQKILYFNKHELLSSMLKIYWFILFFQFLNILIIMIQRLWRL